MKNYFISQFGKPDGEIGRLLGRIMAFSNKKMHKAAANEISDNMKILEIGFGSGSQLEMISEKFRNCELYGVDISEEMLAMASKRLGEKAKLTVCDCAAMSFPDAYFDMVITTDTCYFWKEPQKVLAEIKRITRSDAKLVIAYNAMYASSVHKASGGSMYDDGTISSELSTAGLKIISVRSCGIKQKVFVIRKEI